MLPTGHQKHQVATTGRGRMVIFPAPEAKRMFLPAVVLARCLTAEREKASRRRGQGAHDVMRHTTPQAIGLPLPRTDQAPQRPVFAPRRQRRRPTLQGACASVEDPGDHQPAKPPEVARVGTGKKGLELVEYVVYGGWNACALPQVRGSWVILRLGASPKYAGAAIFQGLISSHESGTELSPATFE